MSYNFTLEIEGAEDKDDIKDALARASELLDGGYTSGDLRRPSIEHGNFDLTGICAENICDGSGEVNDPEGGTKPCLCKQSEHEEDGLDRAERAEAA